MCMQGLGEKGLGSSRKEKREKTRVLLDCEPNMQKKLREKVFLSRSQQAESLGLVREIVDRSFRESQERELVPMQEKCIEIPSCLNHRSNQVVTAWLITLACSVEAYS